MVHFNHLKKATEKGIKTTIPEEDNEQEGTKEAEPKITNIGFNSDDEEIDTQLDEEVDSSSYTEDQIENRGQLMGAQRPHQARKTNIRAHRPNEQTNVVDDLSMSAQRPRDEAPTSGDTIRARRPNDHSRAIQEPILSAQRPHAVNGNNNRVRKPNQYRDVVRELIARTQPSLVERVDQLEEQPGGDAVSAQRPNNPGSSALELRTETQLQQNPMQNIENAVNEGGTVRSSTRMKIVPKYLSDYLVD